MIRRLAILAAHDARLQSRYGIYIAYAFVVAFYVAVLVYLAPALPAWLPGLIIATDPSVVGFFFLGALMMLEKAENTRPAIAISPATAADYLAAKTLTLSAMALVAVSILVPFLHRDANWTLLLLSVLLVSVQFIGIGVPVAGLFKTVTGYLMGAAGLLTPFLLPAALALADPMPQWAILYPPVAQFRLILVATGTGSANGIELAAMIAVSLTGAAACQYWAWRHLRKEFGK